VGIRYAGGEVGHKRKGKDNSDFGLSQAITSREEHGGKKGGVRLKLEKIDRAKKEVWTPARRHQIIS